MFLRDKALAARAPSSKSRRIPSALEDGPEKRELDAFEAQLLKKLIAAKAEAGKGEAFEIADLRLELKLKAAAPLHASRNSSSMPNCSRQRSDG